MGFEEKFDEMRRWGEKNAPSVREPDPISVGMAVALMPMVKMMLGIRDRDAKILHLKTFFIALLHTSLEYDEAYAFLDDLKKTLQGLEKDLNQL